MYNVKEKDTLLSYILKYIEPNRKKAKHLLANNILVNNKKISQFNYSLYPNDTIEIKKIKKTFICKNIPILYEDEDIIVVVKPASILTIATEKEKEHTLYHMVSDYIKEENSKNKIFIIHRLDKETSGIIMFAKKESVKELYQKNWNNLVKYRGYTALVTGIMEKKEATIYLNLAENKMFKTYVAKDGLKAITKYKVIKENNDYSLLDIEIKTGRKNQIRATMEYLKHPIVGDKKYGSNDNSILRVALHAHKLVVKNPLTNKEMCFETNIPTSFYKILKSTK